MKRYINSIPFLFLLFICAAYSCDKEKNATVLTPFPSPGNDSAAVTKKYLALGDSYTIGQSVSVQDRFPVQTKEWLRLNGIMIADPEIIATTGWTTQSLQNAINQQNPTGPYDVISLLIGVNDQYQYVDTGTYRTRFTQLLQKSIQLAGNKPAHVFVLSIPDYSVTPFAAGSDTMRIRQEIDEFNTINKQITLQYNCPYLYITDLTREARYDPTLIANDGLHPSGSEYYQWAIRLGPLMKAVLQ